MSDPNKNVKAMEQIFHEAALVAAEEGRSTPASRAAAKRLSAFARDKLAEVRRAEVAARVPPAQIEAQPVRHGLIGMARDALLRYIDDLRRAHPDLVGFAHHDLSALSDEDLRTMIEDAEFAIHPRA